MPASVHIPDSTLRLFREHGKRVKLQSVNARETCRNPVIEGDVGASSGKHFVFIRDWLQTRFVAHWIDGCDL